MPAAFLVDGTAVVKPNVDTRSLHRGLSRIPLLRINRSGETLDTFRWFREEHSALLLGTVASSFITRQAFNDDPLWAAAPDGSSLLFVERDVVYAAGEPVFGVTAIDAEGDTLYSRAIEYEPIRISRSMRAAA